MRKIAILGIGQIKVDEHWDLSLREMGGNAAFAAMQDAGMEKVDALYVGNMLSPMVSAQNQLGPFSPIGSGCGDRNRLKWRRPVPQAPQRCGPD
jgi:acetyl-CoA acetyltransferase